MDALDDSVQMYATSSVFTGCIVLAEVPIPSQKDLVLKIWAMNIGL